MKSDEELMREYASGGEKAFGELYEKYSPMVYSFIHRRLRQSEAQDFYQKVWRQLHEKRTLYKGQPFAPWFFVMMRHLLIDEYRSLGRRKEDQGELLEKVYGTEVQDHSIDELLEKLPPETRELVEKYYLQGFSYEDLQSETGLSQTNLRQRLSRALRSLRGQV